MKSTSQKIHTIQSLLESHELDATIIPTQDPHGSEYVADRWKRREFTSGFTGSAGTLVVTRQSAALWTDSRYYLQASQQLEGSPIRLQKEGQRGVPEIHEWLSRVLEEGARVGINPEVFSMAHRDTLQEDLEKVGMTLVSLSSDLVDQVWGQELPASPSEPVTAHPLRIAGTPAGEKLRKLRGEMAQRDCGLHIVSALDQIAWLLNLRGADIAFNPVFVAYLAITENGGILLTEGNHFPGDPKDLLPPDIEVRPYDGLFDALKQLAPDVEKIWLDPTTTNARVGDMARELSLEVVSRESPVPGWKARKNPSERIGMQNAHIVDGVAMVRFLHWLDRVAPIEDLNEWQVAKELHNLRSKGEGFKGLSFETISAYGANAAIVHYAPDPESSATLARKGLLLVDSGGQYTGGTTDITRMVALGDPNHREKTLYTTVLRGHLLLSRSVFPKGTDGYQLDVLARAPLWSQALDYGHGTGHGVGAALNVHEGPMSISRRKNLTPLEVGHVVSIEPGYYAPGELGIRVENLVHVEEWPEDTEFLHFVPLTLCPYNRKLILTNLLDTRDIQQIDRFHEKVRERLSPHVEGEVESWLHWATAPLN